MKREYIPNLYERFLALVGLSDIVSGFIQLYGYPNKHEIAAIFPNSKIYDLSNRDGYSLDISTEGKQYDFCFIGSPTKYRSYVINRLRTKFRVFYGTGLDDAERSSIIADSVFSINIPQDIGWHQISPMRIIASARCGRYTLNITDNPRSNFPYLIEASLDDILSKPIDFISSLLVDMQQLPKADCFPANNDLEHLIAAFHGY